MASLAEQELRAMVLGGDLRSGERINEVALAEQLGISRGPLREAIQRLASDGLLDVVNHRGAFVPTIGEKELTELYELRSALESAAVRLAAGRVTEAQLDSLRSELARTQKVLRSTRNRPYPADIDIHQRFVALAGNEALAAMTRDVHTRITLARTRSGSDPDRARAAYEEHVAILECLEARDAEAAARLMESHLARAQESALRQLASSRSPQG
ncbi:GntR family transcriptional regulator [Intrasporangium calvum]|uniref:GntR family transcriptional regulator n=1 Tax=Intrasporangium calvum TaxID=53358 RepID=A0ABT5GKV9_9MICO|nr:GntR family transcriptional regulator [Intrasporangium calvum]MDC5698842.1 GntR family transcriptional regulator [Intrasporangium calvum]